MKYVYEGCILNIQYLGLVYCFVFANKEGARIRNEPILGNDEEDDYTAGYYSVKHEQTDPEVSMDVGDASYMADSYGSYNDEYTGADEDEMMMERSNNGDDTNYDDLVEESLLTVS